VSPRSRALSAAIDRVPLNALGGMTVRFATAEIACDRIHLVAAFVAANHLKAAVTRCPDCCRSRLVVGGFGAVYDSPFSVGQVWVQCDPSSVVRHSDPATGTIAVSGPMACSDCESCGTPPGFVVCVVHVAPASVLCATLAGQSSQISLSNTDTVQPLSKLGAVMVDQVVPWLELI
jgi:hypothetical protein